MGRRVQERLISLWNVGSKKIKSFFFYLPVLRSANKLSTDLQRKYRMRSLMPLQILSDVMSRDHIQGLSLPGTGEPKLACAYRKRLNLPDRLACARARKP